MGYDWSKVSTPAKIAKTNGMKVLVYGPPGSGKTTMIETLGEHEDITVISAESGMLSLGDNETIKVCPVSNYEEFKSLLEDLEEAFANGTRPCEYLAIDSVTEIVEQCFDVMKAAYPGDSWAMYRELKAEIIPILKRFRDLPCTVYVTSECDRDKTDQGRLLYQPRMPGSASDKLPHVFDFVFAARVEEDSEGEPVYVLQTVADRQYLAKKRDKYHRLEKFEAPDLAAIRAKLLGE